MSTPYREPYVEPPRQRAATELGRCPWCRASVAFRRGTRRAVCEACGAMYATAQALVVNEEPDIVLPVRGDQLPLAPEGPPSAAGPVAWRLGPTMLGLLAGLVVLALATQSGGVILWTGCVVLALVSFVRRAVA